MPRDWCRRKFRLPRTLFPLAAAIAAWCLNVSDSSINTPRYLICRLAEIVVPSIRSGGCDERLLLLSLLVRGRLFFFFCLFIILMCDLSRS